MKILITIATTVFVLFGVYTYAESDNNIKFLRNKFWAGPTTVETFEDTKNGIICYVTDGLYSGGISCLKK